MKNKTDTTKNINEIWFQDECVNLSTINMKAINALMKKVIDESK